MNKLPHTGELAVSSAPIPRMTTAVQWLLLLSTATLVLQSTILTPEDVRGALGFSAATFTTHWWTILTYPLVHGGAWHLLMNGYALWLFGPRLEARWGGPAFARFYFLAAVGGWFAQIVFGTATATLIGSTAPTLGVLVAYSRFWGRESAHLFGMVPTSVRWLAVLLGGILLLDGATSNDTAAGAAYLVHAGGLIVAWVSLRAIPPAAIERLRSTVSSVPDEPDDDMPRAVPRHPRRTQPRDRPGNEDRTRGNTTARATRPQPPSSHPVAPVEPATLDQLLDKISEHGLDSLTTDERQWLDNVAQDLRKNGDTGTDGHSPRNG